VGMCSGIGVGARYSVAETNRLALEAPYRSNGIKSAELSALAFGVADPEVLGMLGIQRLSKVTDLVGRVVCPRRRGRLPESLDQREVLAPSSASVFIS
jgi:hypothetical protein